VPAGHDAKEPALIGFYRVVGVLLTDVAGGGQQLITAPVLVDQPAQNIHLRHPSHTVQVCHRYPQIRAKTAVRTGAPQDDRRRRPAGNDPQKSSY
jgi:hypothetical protein